MMIGAVPSIWEYVWGLRQEAAACDPSVIIPGDRKHKEALAPPPAWAGKVRTALTPRDKNQVILTNLWSDVIS